MIGGIIGLVLTGLSTLIIYRVSELKPDFVLTVLVAVYSPLIVWSFSFIMSYNNRIRKDDMATIIGEIGKKADSRETDEKFLSLRGHIDQHKQDDKDKYDLIMKFMESMDTKLDSLLTQKQRR